jgi:sugar phosphate isomerase/epimerase
METAMRIFVLAHSLARTRARSGLPLLSLPRFAVRHGFAGLEVSDRQFSGRGADELRRFAGACADAGCGLLFDINADLTAGEAERRESETGHARAMIAAAAALGAERLRICVGGQALSVQRFFRRRRRRAGPALDLPATGSLGARAAGALMRLGHLARASLPARVRGQEGKTARAVSALRELAAVAGAAGLPLGIENHWGISGDAANVARMIDEVGSPWLGSCPDLGNFPRGADGEAGLRLLAPKAVILHAKSYAFAADGRERRIDYARLLPIFRRAGFAGPVTVEYEGMGDDLAGCLRTRDLVLRTWAE